MWPDRKVRTWPSLVVGEGGWALLVKQLSTELGRRHFMTPSPEPTTLDSALKVTQIAFYIIASAVAVLTYRAAKRGLLNTVNTEYQKRVMDRLQRLSEDLYSEFDPSSPAHWSKMRPVHDAIEGINEVFFRWKDDILAAKAYHYGTPYPADVQRLDTLLHPLRSDPFIPENIREMVVDLVENRLQVMSGIYHTEFERYADRLAKGKQTPLTALDDVNKVHNRIVEQMRTHGCGITQIEVEIHRIRGLIQDYFEAFNPHRRWWHRRRKPPVTTEDQ